ncbi:DinB family protein [Paenibacillus sp. GCM10027626]|uniref:DinB family protein n=1 Tax=Paenibacillus sp. GCM10027626 TaxID=3273411 RepID=UPI00363FC13C
MNTTEALQQFQETAAYYLHELDGFSMEQLRRQPAEGEWSIGQMYQHLIQSALFMHLRNIEQCLAQSSDSTAVMTGKTDAGAAIFEQGSFPPIRIHVPPSPQYTPEQPETKEQLFQGLAFVIRRMKEIEPTLEKASAESAAPHPRFGMLNATEWFLLIEMHYRHHLRQLQRLKQFIGVELG